jgi:hypothetical protein
MYRSTSGGGRSYYDRGRIRRIHRYVVMTTNKYILCLRSDIAIVFFQAGNPSGYSLDIRDATIFNKREAFKQKQTFEDMLEWSQAFVIYVMLS